MSEITQILEKLNAGDPAATEQLLPLVYRELRTLAAARLRKERPGQTLQATALVHDVYLRLVGNRPPDEQQWDSRAHFFAAAAEAMRRILVENARRKKRIRHGGEMERCDMDAVEIETPQIREDLIGLDQALDRLAKIDAQAVQLVHLRYFAGCTNAEAADLLGVSPRTADRIWAFARSWLHQEITGENGS